MAIASKMGQAKTKAQISQAKYDGNPGGEREEGRLVKHLHWVGRKVKLCLARYTAELKCSVCGAQL